MSYLVPETAAFAGSERRIVADFGNG